MSGAPQPPEPGLSRRAFLAAGLAGGGALVLGVGLTACAPGERRAPRLTTVDGLDPDASPEDAPFAPDAFVRIAEDDTVTVICKHFEMGQGAYTGIPTLIAEELDADWAQMRVVAAPADPTRYANLHFRDQATGGSSSISNSFDQMRQAGAAARQMLVAAAAEAWGVPAGEIDVERGVVRHAASGRSARFGELAARAAKQPVPASPRLKPPEQFTLIGQERPRLDTADKCDGSARFTIDAWREDMLTVLIERPTVFGAKLVRFDDRAARAVPGVVAVRAVPQGVAVYAEETWAAIQGRRALEVEWDERVGETRSSEEIVAVSREAARTPGLVAAARGDVDRALEAAAEREDVRVLEAEYVFPFLAHAMLEPLDALIERDPTGDGEAVLVTMGSQGPGREHPAIAERLGLAPEQVRIDNQLAGGSFGRRSQYDSHFAHEIADVFTHQPGDAAARRPTKVLWTREDDIRGGYYRPVAVHRLRGAIDQAGRLVAWDQTVAAQSFMTVAVGERGMPGGIDRTVVEGASNLAYATPDLRVSQQLVETGVPILWWRSVGHTHTGFAVEAFVDELLEAAGRDPVEGRLALLGDHPRHRGVLERAAALAERAGGPAAGCGLGVAVHESFSSYVAQIAEVEVATEPVRRPRVRRVWCAVDCGIAVDPNVVRAQMEGGIGFGLGAALYSEIHLDPGGRVRESNFDRYRSLRIDDMPEVAVAIVDSRERPSGVGEPGVPPIAPAVANAWRRLTGERVSRLPFVREA